MKTSRSRGRMSTTTPYKHRARQAFVRRWCGGNKEVPTYLEVHHSHCGEWLGKSRWRDEARSWSGGGAALVPANGMVFEQKVRLDVECIGREVGWLIEETGLPVWSAPALAESARRPEVAIYTEVHEPAYTHRASGADGGETVVEASRRRSEHRQADCRLGRQSQG